jgi:hypothetical protein
VSKLQQWLTPGKSNTWDLMYLLLVAAIVEFLYKSWTQTPFDPTGFGTGFAALVAAGAGLQWYNNKEDDNDTNRSIPEEHRNVDHCEPGCGQ